MENTRKKPVQKRSIEKYNHILHTGFELIIKNGYHNTTTDDIAKAAGISTGIIYRYFSDKKELLLAALDLFLNSMESTFFKMDSPKDSKDLSFILSTILSKFAELHVTYRDTHEELESLRHSDSDLEEVYGRFESLLVTYTKNALPDDLKELDHLNERVNLCVQLLESYCHLYMKNENMDYSFLEEQVLLSCTNLFIS